MTPAEITSTRKRLDMTQIEFAALIGVSRDTVLRAEKTGRMIPGLETIYRLIDHIGSEALDVLSSDHRPRFAPER